VGGLGVVEERGAAGSEEGVEHGVEAEVGDGEELQGVGCAL
jgi:hypothetical protein